MFVKTHVPATPFGHLPYRDHCAYSDVLRSNRRVSGPPGPRPARPIRSRPPYEGATRTAAYCAVTGATTPWLLPVRCYVLCLGVFKEPVVGAPPADAGLLHAAERRGRVGNQAAVQPDHARLERLRHPQPAAQVAR